MTLFLTKSKYAYEKVMGGKEELIIFSPTGIFYDEYFYVIKNKMTKV